MDCKYKKSWTGLDGSRYLEPCDNEVEVDGLCWEHAYKAIVKELDELKNQLDIERIGHRDQIRKLEAELAAESISTHNSAVEIDELKDILESLVDIQNGPPLIRATDKWNEIMTKAYKLLGR